MKPVIYKSMQTLNLVIQIYIFCTFTRIAKNMFLTQLFEVTEYIIWLHSQ